MSKLPSPRVKEIIKTLAKSVDVENCCYVNLTKSDFLELYCHVIYEGFKSGDFEYLWDPSNICLVAYYGKDGTRIGFVACYTAELTVTNINSGESDIKISAEVTMSTSRKPNQPKIFKTLDSAFNAFHGVTGKITLITEG